MQVISKSTSSSLKQRVTIVVTIFFAASTIIIPSSSFSLLSNSSPYKVNSNNHKNKISSSSIIILESTTSDSIDIDVLAKEHIKDFPIFQNQNNIREQEQESEESGSNDNDNKWIYLDSAATSQKPTIVTQTINDYYNIINSNVHRGAHTVSRQATAAYEDSRDVITKFINANNRNEIIFTKGATEAINIIAYSMRFNFKEGDDIIFSELEHHSNIVPWQLLKQRTLSSANIQLKCININKGQESGYDLNHLESLLTEKTKLVSLQHVSNVLGCIHPIQDIIVPMIRKKAPNAKILLDACQSVPHMPIDVQSLGVDFVAASGHKMCGPTGIGFLWGNEKDLNENLNPFLGGGEMIKDVYIDHSTYADSPAKFEAGTPPIAQAIGLGSAIQYLENIGMDNIHNFEQEMSKYLYNKLSSVPGVTILGPSNNYERASLCAFVCDGVHPSDLSTFLDMDGIAIRAGHHCCQPLHRALGYSHSARASLYIYNTKEDVDTFVKKLEDTLSFLRDVGSGALSAGDDLFL